MSDMDCWERAYELMNNGDERSAVALCSEEPCASESPECQQFLGRTFFRDSNFDKALFWFERLASTGSAVGLYGLGATYYRMMDYSNALKYFHEAANHGYGRSYFWLGLMYQLGIGADQDIQKAKDYYKVSASNGYLIAERALLGINFLHGTTMEQITFVPRYIALLIKTALIAIRDINDERLADAPNVFRCDKN